MSLKHRSQFSSTLDNELLKELKRISKENNMPMSKLLDDAVKLLLRDLNGKYHIHINLPDED